MSRILALLLSEAICLTEESCKLSQLRLDFRDYSSELFFMVLYIFQATRQALILIDDDTLVVF